MIVVVLVAGAIGALAVAAWSLTLCSVGARSAARPGWDSRWRNIDEAVGSGELVGLTRDEVVEAYGEPMTTDKFREWDMVYWLGPERKAMSIDSEWLVIKLEGERVRKVEIARE